MTDLELRALSIRCPVCWSKPQELCRDERGQKIGPHLARVDAYEREFEAQLTTQDYNLAEAEDE